MDWNTLSSNWNLMPSRRLVVLLILIVIYIVMDQILKQNQTMIFQRRKPGLDQAHLVKDFVELQLILKQKKNMNIVSQRWIKFWITISQIELPGLKNWMRWEQINQNPVKTFTILYKVMIDLESTILGERRFLESKCASWLYSYCS